MKQILILGGTQFVGRHLTERLSQRPDVELTLFHRGKTNRGLFSQWHQVYGDRETDDIRQVSRRDWDAVIDFCAYYPRSLSSLAQSLRGRAGRYLLISSISSYQLDDGDGEPVTEQHPLLACSAEEETDTNMLTYGKRKAACERVLFALPDLNPVIFRPGLIYGQYDPTDRFYYWLWRFQKRQQMLIADVLRVRGQWTYAPDFAALLEQALLGPQPPRRAYHNLTHDPLSFAELFDTLAEVSGRRPQSVSVSKDWLEQRELMFWRDLPMLLPFERLFDTSAQQSDFNPTLTPFAESLAQSRAWYASQGWPVPRAGLSPEREDELLGEAA